MKRYDIINLLLEKLNKSSTSYLEIGVQDPNNTFNKIRAHHKVGVDPDPKAKATFTATSDEFFEFINKTTYDVIFIDGLHHYEQVYKDIRNALNVLNEGGFIVCHDMNPTNEMMQVVPRASRIWTGDSWIAWMLMRQQSMGSLEMFVVDTDFGCGVIRKNPAASIPFPFQQVEQTYKFLAKNRQKLLNLIDVPQFRKWLTSDGN